MVVGVGANITITLRSSTVEKDCSNSPSSPWELKVLYQSDSSEDLCDQIFISSDLTGKHNGSKELKPLRLMCNQ